MKDVKIRRLIGQEHVEDEAARKVADD